MGDRLRRVKIVVEMLHLNRFLTKMFKNCQVPWEDQSY
jgi:hypothetical protein